MGRITVTLTMPRVDFVELRDVEIRFMEDGVLRSLDLNEWKAYFPGCGDPVAYWRTARGNEQVWQGTITDKLVDMANSAEFYFISGPTGHRRLEIERALLNLTANPSAFQTRYRPEVAEDDAVPPTVWTLIQFLSTLKNKCEEFPGAEVGIQHDRTMTVTPGYRPSISAGDAQVRSMTANDIRRAYDRGELTQLQFLNEMSRLYHDTLTR